MSYANDLREAFRLYAYIKNDPKYAKRSAMPEPTFTPPAPPAGPYREDPEEQTRRLLAEAQRCLIARDKHIAERDAADRVRAKRDKWLLVLLTIALALDILRLVL